jgi:hypothetical protein
MIHIHAPAPRSIRIQRMWCPHCDKWRFMVNRNYEWYGLYATCLKCGDTWTNEGPLARPFERGWRKRRVAEVKADWRKRGDA